LHFNAARGGVLDQVLHLVRVGLDIVNPSAFQSV
jgi:hypothetical protein